MKVIKLTRDKVTLVDDEDFERFSHHKWCVSKVKSPNRVLWYAVRNSSQTLGKRRLLYLHREILCAGNKDKVDHVNGNGLDNQRGNLRIATVQQNRRNQRKSSGLSSAYKGVYWNKQRGKWRAQIKVNGHARHLGLFENETDAGKAYDSAARTLFGAFANTNF